LKGTNGTDPNTKYFRQMVERGKKVARDGMGTTPG
jgi:hypothetical protein